MSFVPEMMTRNRKWCVLFSGFYGSDSKVLVDSHVVSRVRQVVCPCLCRYKRAIHSPISMTSNLGVSIVYPFL